MNVYKQNNKTDIYKICKSSALFIFLFIGPLILFKPAHDYTSIKNIAGYVFCILLSTAFILQKKRFRGERRTLVLLKAFFIWLICSSLIAPYGYGATRILENYLLYLLIFIIALNIKIEKRDVYLWLSAGFIASVMALCNFMGSERYVLSTFGNPNFFAGHMLMVFPLACALFLSEDNKQGERWILFAVALLFFISILASRSRAAIFASLFGLSTLIFLRYKKSAIIKKYSGYTTLLILSALFFPKFYYWLTTNIRWYIWSGTIKMIRVIPISGWGLGNFPFFYPFYRIREYFLQTEAAPITTQVHNEYLHLWVETGLIGLIIFLALVLFIIFYSAKKKGESRGFEDMCLSGCIAGLSAVLIDNIFSTNLRNPSTAMFFWFLLGVCAGYIGNKEEVNFSVSRYLWHTIAITSFVLSLFTSFYRIIPDVYYKRGVWAKEKGDYQTAIVNYSNTCIINAYNYEVWYKLAYIYGRTGNTEKAETLYLLINNHLFPHYAKTDYNLGVIYKDKKEYEKALYYYKWAEWLNPYDTDILCALASLNIVFLNDSDKAMDYINKVLTIDPKNEYANRIKGLLK